MIAQKLDVNRDHLRLFQSHTFPFSLKKIIHIKINGYMERDFVKCEN